MLIDEMDEIHSLLITLDRQLIQENWRQAYAILKRLEAKIGNVANEVYMHLIEEDQLEPVVEEQ